MDWITANRLQKIIEYMDARTPKKAPHTQEDAIDEAVQFYVLERSNTMANFAAKPNVASAATQQCKKEE